METLTYSELIALVRDRKGAFPVGIEAETDARLLKTNNPNKDALKRSRVVAFTGVDYQASVNREADKQGGEGGFKAGVLPKGRNWLVPNKVLISDDGAKLYLRTSTRPGQRKIHAPKVLAWIADNGRKLTYEEVKPFIPAKGASKKQAAVGVAEGEQVENRDYLFSSLRKLRIGGTSYKIVS